MKGCLIAILFIVLLFLGPTGWVCAAVLGIILLMLSKKIETRDYGSVFSLSGLNFAALRIITVKSGSISSNFIPDDETNSV